MSLLWVAFIYVSGGRRIRAVYSNANKLVNVSRRPMTEYNDINSFENLSEKYSTWIIKYCSAALESLFFLIWFTDTDENSTDRLLKYKSGEIFATNSLTNLKTTILSSFNNLVASKNLHSWLNNFNNLEIKEHCTYDLISIENAIEMNNLDITTIESFVGVVNLYGDFIYQDEKNKHLQIYADNELIKEVWDYFYDCIFWPRFNNKVEFEAWERPQLVINTTALLVKLKDLIKTFDCHIKKT